VKYRVDAGRLTVQAHSKVHDTTTVWNKVSGDVEADADAIESARATFRVDMTSFDAGDWLKNRKLRKDFDMDAHPEATFELRTIKDVVRDGAKFTATADGILRWRGRTFR
jgi:polyisoprenoid-binding protein YceI